MRGLFHTHVVTVSLAVSACMLIPNWHWTRNSHNIERKRSTKYCRKIMITSFDHRLNNCVHVWMRTTYSAKKKVHQQMEFQWHLPFIVFYFIYLRSEHPLFTKCNMTWDWTWTRCARWIIFGAYLNMSIFDYFRCCQWPLTSSLAISGYTLIQATEWIFCTERWMVEKLFVSRWFQHVERSASSSQHMTKNNYYVNIYASSTTETGKHWVNCMEEPDTIVLWCDAIKVSTEQWSKQSNQVNIVRYFTATDHALELFAFTPWAVLLVDF